VSGAAVGEGAERLERACELLVERELDALLVRASYDLRYLSGFTGSNGAAVIRAGGAHAFYTDFRYATQAAEEVPEAFTREIVAGELLDALAAGLAGTSGRLGFDDAATTVAAHGRLLEHLPEGWSLQPSAGLVSGMRLVKGPQEVERIRAAAELADAALEQVLAEGIVGRSERDVAIELELRMRRLGAEGPSFETIVAAGEHGALPHAQPRARQIPRDVLVTIDWGALLDGYCSDCTRTYATGEGISSRAREVYELVLAAQRQGLAAVTAGPTGREVDAVARAVIEQGGEGEHFGHGLGHGVGMEVHEGPRLSRTAAEQPLLAGNVVTVEPGIYIPGALGVRIEDLVVVREGGLELLTSLSKELTVVT
jgi:Xaa-Pro aminopeptidase